MLNIYEYHIKVIKNKNFPFIYPLVFYNGIQKIGLILFCTLTQLSQNDIIEIEKILKSQLI